MNLPSCVVRGRRFWVTEDGRVFSFKQAAWNGLARYGELHQGTNNGYRTVNAKGARRQYVHRLVALTYIPNPTPKERPNINHKDGNPTNNHVSNLEWCSQSENTLHSNRVLGRGAIGKAPWCKGKGGASQLPDGRWRSYYKQGLKQIWVGTFLSKEEAITASQQARIRTLSEKEDETK